VRFYEYKHVVRVSVEAVTWSRESYGLFDYESQHVSRRNLKASSSAKIIRIKNDIRLVTDMYNERNVCENSKTLALLKHQDGVFSVTKHEKKSDRTRSNASENFWLVVKNIKKDNVNQEYQLRENDVIKLGRVKFRVRELHVGEEMDGYQNDTNNDEMSELGSEDTGSIEDDMPKQHLIKQLPENQEITCRVCLNSENTEANPLISPCGCSGSVKHIHLDCLKHWIKSKSHIKSFGLCISYTWKNLECELCHRRLPEIFIHKDERIDLIDLPKPQSSYVILETLAKEQQVSKTFYVVMATENDLIRLGRGHDCDVKINDISASRFHAFIKLSYGRFFLGDNGSKFGTLALIKNDFVIRPYSNISIQIGRTVITFTLINKSPQLLHHNESSGFSCLDGSDVNDNSQEFSKLQYLFQKKDVNFQKLIETVEKVKLDSENNRTHTTPKHDEVSSLSLNSKLFSLTLNKDKDDYSHLQELIENQNKLRINNNNRARSSEEKIRERKNILNEMKNLNINSDDEEEDEENSEEDDIEEIIIESSAFKL